VKGYYKVPLSLLREKFRVRVSTATALILIPPSQPSPFGGEGAGLITTLSD
jgi:hypothetical protein